jgi:cytochrome d ubiquinol oxidase subunit II
MLTGAALVAGYALLGSTWLILKTEGRVQALARQMTRPLVVAVIAAMGLVSSWLPFLDSRLMDRWFSDGNFWWLSPVPLLTLAVAAALWRSATHPRRDLPPFLLSLALFVLGFLGLVLGMWPYLLPPSMTLWQAAAPASSLGFTLVGLVILLPVILGYTAWSYRVFRGKVHADTGYH